MDPNETLTALRALADDYMKDEEMTLVRQSEYLGMMAEQFQNLDEWLSKGGFAPDSWGGSSNRVRATVAGLVDGELNRTDENNDDPTQEDYIADLVRFLSGSESDDAIMYVRPEDVTAHFEGQEEDSPAKTIWQGLNTAQRAEAAETVKGFLENDPEVWGLFHDNIEAGVLTYAGEQM